MKIVFIFDFNSIKVRLKHPYAPQYKSEFIFQFHKGTIKTAAGVLYAFCLFHISIP